MCTFLDKLNEEDKLKINFLDDSGISIKANYYLTTMRPDDTCYEKIPVFNCIAVDKKGRKVGTFSFDIENDTRIFLGGINVDDWARKHGYGSKILDFVDRIATIKGSDIVEGYYGNQGKHVDSFYAKNGYKIVAGADNRLRIRKKVDKWAVVDDIAVSVNGEEMPLYPNEEMEV